MRDPYSDTNSRSEAGQLHTHHAGPRRHKPLSRCSGTSDRRRGRHGDRTRQSLDGLDLSPLPPGIYSELFFQRRRMFRYLHPHRVYEHSSELAQSTYLVYLDLKRKGHTEEYCIKHAKRALWRFIRAIKRRKRMELSNQFEFEGIFETEPEGNWAAPADDQPQRKSTLAEAGTVEPEAATQPACPIDGAFIVDKLKLRCTRAGDLFLMHVSGKTFREIGRHFDISQPVAHRIFWKVANQALKMIPESAVICRELPRGTRRLNKSLHCRNCGFDLRGYVDKQCRTCPECLRTVRHR